METALWSVCRNNIYSVTGVDLTAPKHLGFATGGFADGQFGEGNDVSSGVDLTTDRPTRVGEQLKRARPRHSHRNKDGVRVSALTSGAAPHRPDSAIGVR